MLFPLVYLFFWGVSFQFSSRNTLLFAHFVYRLPYYPGLSIFNCVSWYALVSSFYAFISFLALILVGFLQLHRNAGFMSARFFLTANVSHGALGLALCLVGMHSDAASKWALTKFSYSSIEVAVSDISWRASNLFLRVNVYISHKSLLLSRDQS